MFKSLLSLSVLTSLALAQGPIIAVPSPPIECQPLAVTFSGGTAPYFLSVIPGGQVGATPIEFLPNQSAAGTYSWLVDIASGTSITLAIKDSTGIPNYTQQFTIQAGTTTNCLGKSNPGGAAAAGTTPATNQSAASSASSSLAHAGNGTSSTTSAPASSSTSGAAVVGVTGSAASAVSSVLSKASSQISSVVSSASSSASSASASQTAPAKSGASILELSGVSALVAGVLALMV